MKKLFSIIICLVCVASGLLTHAQTNSVEMNSLRVTGNFEVVLIQSDTAGVALANKADSAEVVILRQGNLLTLASPGKSKRADNTVVTVYFVSLRSIDVAGTANVTSKSIIKGDKLDIHLTGSGSVRLDMGVSILNTALAGSGKMVITGQATEHNLNITGNGHIDAAHLHVSVCKATISGAGHAKVNVKDSLEGSITGSGNIQYAGNPQIKNVNITGSGKMIKM